MTTGALLVGSPSGGTRPAGGLRVVLSSLPSDAHTWNLVYVELVLREMGHVVRNLGACVPQRMLVRECCDTSPDLVVISTVNGHGASEGARAVKALRRDRRTCDVPVVIGGKLTTRGRAGGGVSGQLLRAGFSEVFDDADAERFRAYVGTLAARATW